MTTPVILPSLGAGVKDVTVLRWMNEAGVFGRFIPDFGRVNAQMQFDMYHHYTVDEHSIRAIGLLSRIERGASHGSYTTTMVTLAKTFGCAEGYLMGEVDALAPDIQTIASPDAAPTLGGKPEAQSAADVMVLALDPAALNDATSAAPCSRFVIAQLLSYVPVDDTTRLARFPVQNAASPSDCTVVKLLPGVNTPVEFCAVPVKPSRSSFACVVVIVPDAIGLVESRAAPVFWSSRLAVTPPVISPLLYQLVE